MPANPCSGFIRGVYPATCISCLLWSVSVLAVSRLLILFKNADNEPTAVLLQVKYPHPPHLLPAATLLKHPSVYHLPVDSANA